MISASTVGRSALARQHLQEPTRRLVALILDESSTADVPACSAVYAGSELIGITTSGVWSHTLSCSVALAYLRADCARPVEP